MKRKTGTNPCKIQRLFKIMHLSFLKVLLVFTLFLIYGASQVFSQNPISIENAKTGNPSSEWDISGAGDLTIQGFGTQISVNKGETISYKIKTDATVYTIKIYRIGYYDGKGARLIADLGSFTGVAQPDPTYYPITGTTDCGNWAESAHWDVPETAVSGIYIAKLTRTDNSGSSHIVFIVRDDNGNSDILFKTSDATWQAYNVFGGHSLYVGGADGPPALNHASKVSYNRPFITRNGGGGGASEDWLFNAEYPMVRWLERNGYNVSYTTDLDMDRDPIGITPEGTGGTYAHKLLLSVGHDEYWSGAERTKFENARNAGVHLAFFSGNEVYWKTRWEDNNRTLVCYKEGTLGENVCGGNCDPTDTWTGLWRDGNPSQYPGSDGGRPENALTGQISWDGTTSAIQVPDIYKSYRFWRNTSVASLSSGASATFPDGTLGYEWDWEHYQDYYPAGRITLSETTSGSHTHKLSLYRHPSGSLVFGAGTVQWSWGLDNEHDRGNTAPSWDMQQATLNLFADMGVQPATKQTDLFAASASTDVTPAVSAITYPVHGNSFAAGSQVTITGTTSDVGGIVAGVDISVDGGITWKPASGTTNWTFTWTPTIQGAVTIKTHGFDDSGNIEALETATNVITITITEPVAKICPCTIFSTTETPPIENDNNSVELGVKFQSSVDGFITGIRFYKGSSNTGVHTGYLWSTINTTYPLAIVTFTNETSSGWQEATLSIPVAITANTTYVASYHTATGYYAANVGYFTDNNLVNLPLTALQNGTNGSNGVYKYGSGGIYPTDTHQSSNYWVDVVFNTYIGPDITPPVVISVSPSSTATGVSISTQPTAVFNEALKASSVNVSSVIMTGPGNASVSGSVSVSAGTITFTPSSSLAYNTTYTLKLNGGYSTPRIEDLAGNGLSSDYTTWSFTTSSPPPPPPTEGPGGPILVIGSATNPFSRYPVEILRAEGFNEFFAMDISEVTDEILNSYDVVILGEFPISAGFVTTITNWVNAGGLLVAFKPDAQLSGLLGITPASGTLSDKYLLVNTTSGPGVGIVAETIQYHSAADLYTLNGATSLATLYSTATIPTEYPAVTEKIIGSNGGKAYAFTYDLARSVVYTHQGNPAWAGQKRDGKIDPRRSDDMFYGNATFDPQPDWIDLNKVAIPQADEQQRLLSNIIVKGTKHRKIMPRFWFLPKGLKAAIVMTGDDHGDAGMAPRFMQDIAMSPAGCNVDDWECVRSTGYLYLGNNFTNEQAVYYESLGFETAIHINTGCSNFTKPQYETYVANDLAAFAAKYMDIKQPTTNRNHCIAYPDWSTVAEVSASHGIRLDVNYYYWPNDWMLNRPGMFTGSGNPMRFAKLDGTIIDCYQVVTQMQDEGQYQPVTQYPQFCDALLDKAIGTEGYYGVFCTNMHFDNTNHAGANAITASAQAHGVPVISAKQMLDWLDGRNASSFNSIQWVDNKLSFGISAATGSRNMKGMIPLASANGTLNSMTYDNNPLTYTTETIKGIQYAFFDATKGTGTYVADYSPDLTAPVISNVVATPGNGTAIITWTTNEASDSKVEHGTSAASLSESSINVVLVTNHSITLTGLSSGTAYYYRVTSADASSNSASLPVSPATSDFAMPAGPCANDITTADFNSGTIDANTVVISDGDGAVSLKPTLNDEFSGTSIPSGWTNGVFEGQLTNTIVNAGSVTVNGTHIFYNSTFTQGTSLEFTATFNSAKFQNVGFSSDQPFNDAPWITIGQGESPDGNLYARASNNTSINLGSNLLGSSHHYQIKWNAGNFEFYVDGSTTPSATISLTVTIPMYIQISDVGTGDGLLSVDWVLATPYATPGTFTSRVFDAGTDLNWGAVNWNADVPATTSLAVSVRKGNTPTPDGNWTAYIPATNGSNVGCGSARYIQYKADFTTTSNNVSARLKDISIACGVAADGTPPVISSVVETPNPAGTALITWTTDEGSTSDVDYGTAAGNLNLNSSNATLELSHSITLTSLTPGWTYYYKISSADCNSNLTSTPVASFTVPFPVTICFQDQLTADFTAGTQSNTYLTTTTDGEVTIQPLIAEDFSGISIPTGWQSFAWSEGTSSIAGGSVIVDGARFNTVPASTTYGPGSSMEFRATFGAAAFQHIGFGGGSDATTLDGIFTGQSPWAMFSTGNQSSDLKTRTSLNGSTSADFDIPGSYLGSSHLYRIEWNANSVSYYIDGVLKHTESATIAGAMRPAISDYNIADPGISVDWIHVTPYNSSGTFTSRIYDAGVVKNWGVSSWTADVPTGTTLQLSQRQSNSAVSILSAGWTEIPSNGTTIGGTSQFIQYKADFVTTNTALTPVLKDVSVTCSTPDNVLPVVTTHPYTQTICSGKPGSFISGASGNPAPAVQWQESTNNGSDWSDIPLATSPVYTFTAITDDNGKQYKAIWTNPIGSVTSNIAVLTVNPLPTAAISVPENPICPGATFSLKLDGATGTSPYSLVVNGVTYPYVTSGQIFATFNPAEFSIWGSSGTPANASANDGQAIEVGTKIRSTISGYITGIRFYKGTSNSGTHTANLWTVGGLLMASATFTAETASGWQEVRFATPVAISANTTYIASYLSPGGGFAITTSGLSSGVTNGSLTALASGVDGVNGVYKYGGGFPNGGNTANYWVDVLFTQSISTSPTYNLTSITDADGCTSTESPLSSVTVTTSPLPAGTIAATPATVCEGSSINLTYTATAGTGPFSLLINGITYPNIISGSLFSAGGATYNGTTSTIFSPSSVGGENKADITATELGIRVKSSVDGTISGIRFYKTGTNILNFTGSLWTEGNTTTPLATANYTSDNSPGWKQINFATPVEISANTSYIASYFSPNGNYYAYTANGLTNPLINAPLTAEASYYKQPGPGYPNINSAANYWVDVVFSTSSSISTFNLTSIASTAGCTTTGNPISTASVTVEACNIYWTGNVDTDWNTPGNWNPASVPTATYSVIIPDVTNDPVIYNLPDSPALCYSLTVAPGAALTINAGKALTVNGSLTNNAGNTGLVVKSDVSGTGTLITKGTVNGNATVERYITGAVEAWHLLSSPVAAQPIDGEFTPSGTYDGGTGYDFYAWNESSGMWLNQKVSVNAITQFIPGKGYLVAYQATNPTKTFTGTLNSGLYSIPMTASGTGTYTSTNLAGNPYPSSLDWKSDSGWDKSKIAVASGGHNLYIWNESATNYGVYNDAGSNDNGTNGVTRYITPMQGFFVIASSAGNLGINNNTRIHSSQNWLKSGINEQSLRLRVTAPENKGSDEISLEFGHTSSEGGAAKWFSFIPTAPSLYTPKSGSDYSISFLTSVSENSVIPVNFKAGSDGEYSLSANLQYMPDMSVYLTDTKLIKTQKLSGNPVYNFSASVGDQPDRFILHFGSEFLGLKPANINANFSVWYNEGDIYFSSLPEKVLSMSLIDMTGREIVSLGKPETDKISVGKKLAPGYYLVRINMSDKMITRKLFIN